MTEERYKNGSPELSEQDAELLSTYIDNRLTADERASLEARLNTNPFLRSELRAMQRTVSWLNQMPSRKAPRDFMLSLADVAQQPKPIKLPPRRTNPLWLSAAAAIVVIVFGGAIMLTVIGPNIGTSFEQVSSNLGADEMAGEPASDSESVEIAAQSTQQSVLPTATPIVPAAQQQAPIVNEAVVEEEAEAQEPPQESRDEAESDAADQDGLMDTTTTSQSDAGAAAEAQRSFPQPSPTFELFLGATEVIAPVGTPVAEIATEGDGASSVVGEANFASIPQTATAISQSLPTLEPAPDSAAADDAVETSNVATLPPTATTLSLPNTGGGAGSIQPFIGPQEATDQEKARLNTPAEIIRRALENIRNSILEVRGRG